MWREGADGWEEPRLPHRHDHAFRHRQLRFGDGHGHAALADSVEVVIQNVVIKEHLRNKKVHTRINLDFQVLDIDEGCGVIKYDGPKDFSNYTVTDLSYNDVFLDTDVRNKIMHVKSIQEFLLNV